MTRTSRRSYRCPLAAPTGGGAPADAELAELRAAPREGISVERFEEILERHLASITGRTYRVLGGDEGLGDREVGKKRHLDAIERALRAGFDVPFEISEPPHWMFMSAVAGETPERRFLVTDPWAGRTRWVEEKSLASGDFIVDLFKLDEEEKGGFVDFVFVPEEAP